MHIFFQLIFSSLSILSAPLPSLSSLFPHLFSPLPVSQNAASDPALSNNATFHFQRELGLTAYLGSVLKLKHHIWQLSSSSL